VSRNGNVKPESATAFAVKFVMHQFIGVWGVGLSVSNVTALPFAVLRLFGKTYSMEYFRWLLNGRPYFPIQISLGILLGWVFGRHLWHRSMVWVWVLPLVYLSYAFVAIPTLTPNLVPPEFQAGIGESRFWHYFGWGCGPWNHCIDQTAFTLPFYMAAAYSIGALIACTASRRAHIDARLEAGAILILGIWFFLAALRDFYFSVSTQWHWMILPYESVSAGIGAILILLALANWRVLNPRAVATDGAQQDK